MHRRRSVPLFAAAAALSCVAAAVAQPPADLRALPIPAPLAAPAPLTLPGAAPSAAAEFGLMPDPAAGLPPAVSAVSDTGGGFEVVVGRTRLLTLKLGPPA